jgi:catechol 2,3-dioxygenase-like lactoylglutathione lyase family enzyme
MIDHISIGVRDLAKGERFYAAALAMLGFAKLKDWEGAAIGFGKKYPEFWINKGEAMGRVAEDSGVHICLRAPGGHSLRRRGFAHTPSLWRLAAGWRRAVQQC